MWIIKNRKIFLSLGAILVGASIFAVSVWGLNLGIDFSGGSLLEIEFSQSRPESQIIKDNLADFDLGEISIQPVENSSYLIRMKDIDEDRHQEILTKLEGINNDTGIIEKRFESVGPIIGQELKQKAFWAIIFVLIMVVLFVAYAFRKVTRPVSSWRYGLVAIIALAHDVLIPIGIFAILGQFFGKEVGLLFVTALLTILGFSVHDTIVVFDRIRENLRRGVGSNFPETVGLSLSQVITRSIITSLAVLLTLLAIFIFGGESIKDFSLVLIIGIFSGTYSSLFIASPFLVIWQEWKNN